MTYTDTGLIRYWNTRRYYKTYTETELIRYRSTRRYYRTYSETGLSQGQELIRDRTYSGTGVPVGTSELKQIQEYP